MSSAQDVVVQGAARDPRHMQNALQHAFLLQNRKDIEAEILTTIEELSEVPRSKQHTSRERELFIGSISIFQPTDFDDLVLERVALRRCGYVLCQQEPRSASGRAWQISKAAQSFCSSDCQSKAAFVRAQLITIPAWERTADERVQIVLPEDKRSITVKENKRRKANAELAFERGEEATSKKPEKVMSMSIVEKAVTTTVPIAPHLNDQPDGIEGYVPKQAGQDASSVLSDLATMQITSTINTSATSTTNVSTTDEDKAWKDMFKAMHSS